jgi:predicted homoserine dehydrogenase-like protein
MGIWQQLEDRAASGRSARVAIVGAGYVGSSLLHRLRRTPGIDPVLVVNRTPDPGRAAWAAVGVDASTLCVSDDPATLAEAIDQGVPALATAREAVTLEQIDVVVEVTGSIGHGGTTMLAALEAGRHVVSLNAEVDAAIGHLLHHVARDHGVVYTIADGDQPGGMLRTHTWVRAMGFDPIVIANCKRHLDRHQNPTTSAPYAERDGTSVKVTTSAGDGTKLQIECAVVANVTGFEPDCRGMHGVPTTLARAVDDLRAVESRDHVVEYTLGGDFGSGVFVIGRAPEPDAVARSLRFYKMGSGPEYLFLRPYTLAQFEIPETIADVWINGHALATPAGPPVAEVLTIAKRDLRAGESLDGIGGYTCYGAVDSRTRAHGVLPIALADAAVLRRDVPRDAPIPLDAVEIDEWAEIVALRRRQDALIGDASGSGGAAGHPPE